MKKRFAISSILVMGICLLPAVGRAGPELTTAPIKWFDADNKTIPLPREVEDNVIWDIADHTFFYQVGKVLDLGWTARRIGNILHLAPPRQADNANALDEVPNSSWYTNRHFLHPMSIAELREGPGFARPDTSGPWEIIAGKCEGVAAGFTIKDAAGTIFFLKFDCKGNDEMASAAEVIAARVLHAAGYNVPRISVVYFDPARLRISPKAKVGVVGGGKRPMTEEDLQNILDNIIIQPDGRIRCVACQCLGGKPVGNFDYHGTRKDDPNDRVDHQHRRELRGLKVIGSWMNDTDRRAANSLDMYVTEEDGRSYLKHCIIDMGATFGSNSLKPHGPKYGNEYVLAPRTIGRSIVSLGLYRKAWEEPLPIKYPELGYFENETFRPGKWVPSYPNPAFERCTSRDGYWGAKIIMSFSDEEIAAMVETGRYSNPGAAAELTRLLSERRDMIGRYWFGRVNPLDHFAIDGDEVHFEDLAIERKLESASGTRYHYRLLDEKGKRIGLERVLEGDTRITIDESLSPGQFHGYEIRTRRDGEESSKYTRVYLYKWEEGRHQLVRVERQG